MSRKPSRPPTLFDMPRPAAPEPAAPTGPRPWDPIDRADEELGWQHRWITPARARDIRIELGR